MNSNRIRTLTITQQLHNLAAPEFWLRIEVERMTAATQVQGRITGPRCAYATTVEVAYPLRPPTRAPEDAPAIDRRVIIPEASFWDVQSPFLYEGNVELWQDGVKCDQVTFRRGLRTLQVGPRGLRWNGRLVKLHGRRQAPRSEDEALQWRAEGCNSLLVPLEAASECWDMADRWGFLLLSVIESPATALEQLEPGAQHPCCLGWLLGGAALVDSKVRARVLATAHEWGGIVGVQYCASESPDAMRDLNFIAAAANELPLLQNMAIPRLLLASEGPPPASPTNGPCLIGWIQQ